MYITASSFSVQIRVFRYTWSTYLYQLPTDRRTTAYHIKDDSTHQREFKREFKIHRQINWPEAGRKLEIIRCKQAGGSDRKIRKKNQSSRTSFRSSTWLSQCGKISSRQERPCQLSSSSLLLVKHRCLEGNQLQLYLCGDESQIYLSTHEYFNRFNYGWILQFYDFLQKGV